MHEPTQPNQALPCVNVLDIRPSRKSSAIADLTIEIQTKCGTITIADCRILRNRQNQTWMAMPSYPVPTSGRDFKYEQTVLLSKELRRAVDDAALAGFEKWDAARNKAVVQS